jgi:hypothetical protein
MSLSWFGRTAERGATYPTSDAPVCHSATKWALHISFFRTIIPALGLLAYTRFSLQRINYGKVNDGMIVVFQPIFIFIGYVLLLVPGTCCVTVYRSLQEFPLGGAEVAQFIQTHWKAV